MKDKLGDEARLHHILDAITEIESYIQDSTFNSFAQHSMMKNATIKQMEIIGEAANQLSIDLKQNNSNVQWREIIGLRNILIHEYFGVDDFIIWGITKYDLPIFKSHIEQILKELPE